MTLDDRIRRGLTRRASDGELDIDHELDHVRDISARRTRRTRTVRVAIAVALVLALGTTALVMSSGDNGHERVVRTRHGELVEAAPDAKVIVAKVDRAPAVSTDVGTLVHDDTAFAFDLYQKLASGNRDNLFFSPQSVSTALAMTYAGAKSNTATEMAKALHFELDPGKLHAAFNALDQQLLARRSVPADAAGQPLKLEIDNSLWAQHGREFVKSFLDTLAGDYGAPVHLVDFAQSPQEAADTINAYVTSHTHGRIPRLLSPADVDTMTRLYLVNTVYFKASWVTPFQPAPSMPFHLLDGTIIRPAMMTADNAPLSAVQTSAYDAVRIPYLGGASMQLVIPTAGQFDQVESQLSGDLLAQIRAAETPRAVRLTMPKFKFSTRALLNDDLKALGMRDAFTPAADFTGLSPSRDLDIKSVVHQATVSVDEAGTEATAATGVGLQVLAGVGSRALSLTVDRPFLVVIEDDATHAVLFAGRVTNPDAH